MPYKNHEEQLEYHKKYRIRNKEKLKEQDRQNYLKNRAKRIEQQKIYYLNNKEARIQYNKDYYVKNKDDMNIKHKQYVNTHMTEIRETQRNYYHSVQKNNPLYKKGKILVNKIKYWLKYCKNPKADYQLLGCSLRGFKKHLELKFQEGMSWDNYGQWHIDHIIPLSKAIDEDSLINLFHYTNCQPLWAIDNIKKGNRIYA